ncbi:MAG: carotenoid biosynthesis protein [Chloroflexi bacterium]|nr:MAG: carotenoid biosynthesis protein [Chloroflexota bacterium]
MRTRLSRFLKLLVIIFCVAYPIAVIGVAFNVRPPFSMSWAASVLLILEGVMVTVAWMDEYGPRGLFASLVIALFSYGVETLGVHTGFPFGPYRYTDVLFPVLPGGVPLPVIFAWLTIIIAVRSLTIRPPLLVGSRLSISIVVSALLATLLNLVLEPVAFHIERYWIWLAPGNIAYYGVPLMNFVAWFVASLVLLSLVNVILLRAIAFLDLTTFSSRLPLNVPTWLYFAIVFMFGLVNLTHGFYLAAGIAALAIILPIVLTSLPANTALPIIATDGIEQDQTFQRNRKRVKKARKKKKR